MMLLDTNLPPVPLNSVPSIACAAEKMGFGTIWTNETIHNPFLPGVLISEHTQRIHFGTAVAVSFARSPATLAYTAWDLAQASGGRFILGLGTQVKAHIERRFGMSWPASVVGKLRDQIQAIRAYWHAWQTGGRLNYRGDYYKLNLMTPFFNPGPIKQPEIPIFIAGVKTALARLAGEVADGFHVHPLHSIDYLSNVLKPAIQEGLVKSGRRREALSLSTTTFVVTSSDENQFVRAQIAFYASTPSYRAVMAHHGWQDAAEKLSALASRGRWADMPILITDEMVAVFAVVANPHELAEAITNRYQGLVDRLTLYTPFVPGERDDFWRLLINNMQ